MNKTTNDTKRSDNREMAEEDQMLATADPTLAPGKDAEKLSQTPATEQPVADEPAIHRINESLDLADAGLEELTRMEPDASGRHFQLAIAEETHRTEAVQSTEQTQQQHVALSTSLVMTVYNQRHSLEEALERIVSLGFADQIIVVDDRSTDGTAELLAELAGRMPLVVETHERHQGKGAAVRTAMQLANSELIAIHDADLQYDPAEIAVLVKPIESGCCDAIFGSRYLAPVSSDPSLFHERGTRWLTRMSNFFTGQNLTDMSTCYKVFRRSLLEDVELRENGIGIESELTAKLARAAGRIYELPITFRRNMADSAKQVGFLDGLRAAWCILRYRWID